jgi:hypothetical protein
VIQSSGIVCNTPRRIFPGYFALARQYTLCDQFFSELAGPSTPSHLMLTTADSPVINNPPFSSTPKNFKSYKFLCANYLAHKEDRGSLSSGLPDDQVLSRGFNDVHRQGLKVVNREYALHLRQQANEQAEVAAG